MRQLAWAISNPCKARNSAHPPNKIGVTSASQNRCNFRTGSGFDRKQLRIDGYWRPPADGSDPEGKRLPVIRITRCGDYGPFEADQDEDEG
jgi:hypothetical protein